MAKPGSIKPKAMQWKARSQAAYQGYSHLSGIEMTSLLLWCRHRLLRPCLRLRRRRTRRIPIEPLRDIEVENLLAPDQTGQRLALDTRLVLGQPALRERRVERICFSDAVGEDLLGVGEGARRYARSPAARTVSVAPGAIWNR